jgi:hypothetical protein
MFSVLHANWFGNKPIDIPLSRTQSPERIESGEQEKKANAGTSRGHLKWFFFFAILALTTIAGLDLYVRLRGQTSTIISENGDDSFRLDGSFPSSRMTGAPSTTPSENEDDSLRFDGSSLASRMKNAKEKLSNEEAMIRDVLGKHLSCISAKAVPGKDGSSPLDMDPKTGEIFVNVLVRFDNEKYDQFAKNVIKKLGSVAVRRETIKVEDRGGELCFGEGYDSPFPLFVVGRNLRIPTAEVLWFKGNYYDFVVKYIDVGYPAVGVFLRNRSGEIIAEGADCCYGKTEWNNAYRTSSVISCYDGYTFIAPSLMFNCGIGWTTPYVSYPKDGPATEMHLSISLGKFKNEELKDFGKLDIKLGHLKDDKFVE